MLVWRRAERVGVVLEGSDWSTAIMPENCIIGLALLSYCIYLMFVSSQERGFEPRCSQPYDLYYEHTSC